MPIRIVTPFERWWHEEGSEIRPKPSEDAEEFARRVCEIAWSNGSYSERTRNDKPYIYAKASTQKPE